MMFGENPKRREFYHHARRFLKERGGAAYERATVPEIERIADYLRYEAFREATQPYRVIKEKLLSDFYNLQINPCTPLPEYLQEQLAELDTMIAAVAREFGYEAETVRS